MVVTRKEGGCVEGELSKGGQICSNERKLDFGGEQAIEYTDTKL